MNAGHRGTAELDNHADPGVEANGTSGVDTLSALVATRDIERLRRYIVQTPLLPVVASKPGSGTSVDSAVENTTSTLRGAAWHLLCRPAKRARITPYVAVVDTLAQRSSSMVACLEKIAADVPRTWPGVTQFTARVSRSALSRVLAAAALANDARYVQGLNVIAGAFLYVLPEPLAYDALVSFTRSYAPTYFLCNDLRGVHRGCALAAHILRLVDAELAQALEAAANIPLEQAMLVHAFPAILSMSLSVPPLDDAITLFDLVIAFGAHLSVLLAVARLVAGRGPLLQRQHSMQQVLNPRRPEDAVCIPATQIARECIRIAVLLPEPLRDALCTHTLIDKAVALDA